MVKYLKYQIILGLIKENTTLKIKNKKFFFLNYNPWALEWGRIAGLFGLMIGASKASSVPKSVRTYGTEVRCGLTISLWYRMNITSTMMCTKNLKFLLRGKQQFGWKIGFYRGTYNTESGLGVKTLMFPALSEPPYKIGGSNAQFGHTIQNGYPDLSGHLAQDRLHCVYGVKGST